MRGFDSRRLHFSLLRALLRWERFASQGFDRNSCPRSFAPDFLELVLTPARVRQRYHQRSSAGPESGLSRFSRSLNPACAWSRVPGLWRTSSGISVAARCFSLQRAGATEVSAARWQVTARFYEKAGYFTR